eukprot:TRINITY_DN512_c0_g1_i2.p1 TRINITY_DN512_c0_g1~~TRINITY_DN512_c0_g1_i2.p1  ORF type:complete len:324 (+),score=1.75 TRINITY_DN512_c0_g1_i2:746-1717(+)
MPCCLVQAQPPFMPMAQHGHGNPRYGGHSSHFGDTTYTKVFVGGLAWETQTETMRKYFEQFGDILEAVVITDRMTGRSKGYGFVTFRDPEAAKRACLDPSPVIDGRRANCNLAAQGQKQRQQYGQQSGVPFSGYPQQQPYPMFPQQGFPMTPFGFPTQFQEGGSYAFPQGMYPQYGPHGFAGQPGVYGPQMAGAPGAVFPGYPPGAFGAAQAAQAQAGFQGPTAGFQQGQQASGSSGTPQMYGSPQVGYQMQGGQQVGGQLGSSAPGPMQLGGGAGHDTSQSQSLGGTGLDDQGTMSTSQFQGGLPGSQVQYPGQHHGQGPTG